MPKVLITGVSDGIGSKLYEYYLMKGWEVWGTARHGKSNNILLKINSDYLDRAHTIDLDLENLNECENISKSFGSDLDIIILNAAEFGSDCYYYNQFDLAKFLKLFSVNVFSNLILIKNLLPKITIDRVGKLIYISTGNASIHGNSTNEMFGYKITKTAMNQSIRTISNDLKDKNIISVCLNPGWVKTKIGGLNAPLTTDLVAESIYYFIENLNYSHNGKFLNTDLTELPW
jgi:short-subunit dehydrogenase